MSKLQESADAPDLSTIRFAFFPVGIVSVVNASGSSTLAFVPQFPTLRQSETVSDIFYTLTNDRI